MVILNKCRQEIQPAVRCALTRLQFSRCKTDTTKYIYIFAENIRDLAAIGEYRTFLVSDIELLTDQSRVDQENQIVQ